MAAFKPAAVGELTYGGVEFDPFVKSKITATPKDTPCGRATEWVEYKLSVTAHVTGGNGTLESMRKTLTQDGNVLKFSGRGFGTLNINNGAPGGGAVSDINYGPKPRMLSWVPLGTGAAIVEWECTTCVAEGATQSIIAGGTITSLAYSVAFAIDDRGYSTVTYQGEVNIAGFRNGTLSNYNADLVREKITPTRLPGFQRTQNYTVEPSRRTLKFNIVDKELPHAYPEGVAHAQAHHKISSSLKKYPGGFVGFTGSIDATFEMASDQPKALAWTKFVALVYSRVGLMGPGGKLTAQRGGQVILEDVEIGDDIYGKTATFGIKYTVLGSSLKSILTNSNMFSDPPGDDLSWTRSMSGSALAPRGSAKLRQSENDDQIVTMVLGGSPTVEVSVDNLDDREKTTSSNSSNGTVTAAASWLHWECDVQVYNDGRVALHKHLGDPKQTTNTTAPLATGAGLPALIGRTLAIGINSTLPDLIQRTKPGYRVILSGKALRLGNKIAVPRLQQQDIGVAFDVANTWAMSDQPTSLGGIPLFRAIWRIEYVLKAAPPGDIKAPVNPMQGLNAQ